LAVFADSDDERTVHTARTTRSRPTEGGRSAATKRRGGEAGASLLAASREGGDPVDLLDAGASRQLLQAAGMRQRRGAGRGDDGPDLETNAAGQLVIKVQIGKTM
jgi:hypothetical protein